MIYLYNIAFDIFYYSTEEFLKYFSLSSSQIFERPNVVVPPVFYFFKSKSATIVFSFLRPLALTSLYFRNSRSFSFLRVILWLIRRKN